MIAEYATRGELMAAIVAPHGVGAEIGVLLGQHAAELIGVCAPRRMWLVDPWEQCDEVDPAWGDHRQRVAARLQNRSTIVELVQSTGLAWLSEQQAGSLDWCYIDSSHYYEQTRDEIREACRVVRGGGVIAGHDLVVAHAAYWGSGVVRAVIEACQDGLMEMVGVSCEAWPSWGCIRRIDG
jgi:hypothetical protein